MKKPMSLKTFQQTQDLTEQQSNIIITHRLKPKKKDDWQTCSISNNQKSISSTNELLSSISTKLHPRNISISTASKSSNIKNERIQVKISCLEKFNIPKFSLTFSETSLNFQELRKKAFKRKLPSIVSEALCSQNPKKLCTDNNCKVKARWTSKLIIEPRQLKQVQNLKNDVMNNKQQSIYDLQIQKDVLRSFPGKILPKPRITLYHVNNQKQSIIQILRTVLKMLTINDSDVGYVQGMNLYTGVIVSHIKQIQISYLFTKQVMKYGNMRTMYWHNFRDMKQLCNQMLNRHIKLLMYDLFEVFIEAGVTIQLFMPFYLSMFACVADYNVMHCIIDQFMSKGFLFLDKLMLSMLCYLKCQFLKAEPLEVACKLGASFIRQKQVPWDQVINLTQTFELN